MTREHTHKNRMSKAYPFRWPRTLFSVCVAIYSKYVRIHDGWWWWLFLCHFQPFIYSSAYHFLLKHKTEEMQLQSTQVHRTHRIASHRVCAFIDLNGWMNEHHKINCGECEGCPRFYLSRSPHFYVRCTHTNCVFFSSGLQTYHRFLSRWVVITFLSYKQTEEEITKNVVHTPVSQLSEPVNISLSLFHQLAHSLAS